MTAPLPPAPLGSSRPAARRPLASRIVPTGIARRFTRALVALVTAALVTTGAVNMWLQYTRATVSAVGVQREKAVAAADRVANFIQDIEAQIGWTTRAEWASVGTEQRRYDFARLLRQVPSINDLLFIDGRGREQLRLSRLEPDVVDSAADLSTAPRFARAVADRTWYSPVYYRRGSEPYMILSVAHAGRNPGVTSADVNLKFIWDVVAAIRVGEDGYAYVVDSGGRLVAHPDMSLVLRESNLASLPQVESALRSAQPAASVEQAAVGVDGRPVLSAFARIPKLDWLVFVELPRREVLAPVLTGLYQTLALLALSIVVALVLGSWVARRMVVPIQQLQAGAQRLGEGDLHQRISVASGDEIEALAHRFNMMAARIQDAQETLEAKVADRTRELARSLAELRAAQDRLIQTEKLASLGQLTAGIAHEIKNPLNFVNNFAELSAELVRELGEVLAKAGVDPALRDEVAELSAMLQANLERIVQHGRRADSIVRNMLAHSRDGGGELRLVDLNATVEEALNLSYHGARAEQPTVNVTLERDLDPAAGQILIYPQEFTRALLNLISNGLHAVRRKQLETAADGYQPVLGVATRALPGGIEVRVRDNGTGIPATVRAHIFEPFFTTKPAGEGTGLGLSLAHDIIVKQHGGTIEVTTEPGRFTEFVIALPRAAVPAEAGA